MGDRASITHVSSDDIAFESARIDCPRCESIGGWDGERSGLYCPYGCGVRLFSVQAEETARYNAEGDVREQIRRDKRMLRKARKANLVACRGTGGGSGD